MLLIDTVENNKTTYKKITKDKSSRKLKKNIRLTTKNLIQFVGGEMNDNCLINRQAIKDALHNFSPDNPYLQGKNMQMGGWHANLEQITPISYVTSS